MSNLTFYTNPQSRGRMVRWMLEEVGIPYETKVLDYGPAMKSPEYLAINPMGKVPAIKHGNTIVTEVAAICAYLADQFPEKGLAPPPGDPARGPYYRWLFFAAGPIELTMTARSFGLDIDDEMAHTIGCGHYDSVMQTLEQAVAAADPWLCGERFTAADLLIASYIGYQVMMKMIPPNPVLDAYVQRAESRPAAKRADALDGEIVLEN
jgi:glutathione S-transferase